MHLIHIGLTVEKAQCLYNTCVSTKKVTGARGNVHLRETLRHYIHLIRTAMEQLCLLYRKSLYFSRPGGFIRNSSLKNKIHKKM